MQGKAVNPSHPERSTGSPEAQLREALDHMGGRRLSLASGASGSRSGGLAASQRHRYVRDGEVPVVHATLGRHAAKPDLPATQHDRAMLDAVRQDLDRERAMREAAERSLQEARAQLTALQTRIAHLEMDLQSVQEQAAAAAAQPAATPEPARRRRTRARTSQAKTKPIKWWVKSPKT